LLAKAGAGIALTVAFAGGWWLRAHGFTLGELQNELKQGSDPRFDWRSVDKKHWQALGRAGDTSAEPSVESVELTDTAKQTAPAATPAWPA